MIRADLDAARLAWLDAAPNEAARKTREKMDFLRYANATGQVADFHSTRHTYISGIVAGGASVKTAQELARHSTPVLTIGRYSHARRRDLRKALDSLPSLTPKAPQDAMAEPSLSPGGDGAAEADLSLPVNRHSRSGETCENRARRGEWNEGYGGAETESSDDPQGSTLSGLGEAAAPRGETGQDVGIGRRRPDSNRGWRICNPLP